MELFSKIKSRMHAGKPSMSSSVLHSAANSDRKVFAHYMVGITYGQTQAQWGHDVNTAKEAGIDGFALNIGPSDHYTDIQLQQAYTAAEKAGNFVLFLSFDMAAGEWPVSRVVSLINHFKESSAQMTVHGTPFVSTFEGPGWAENWFSVRMQTGGIFLVPDWSSLGPYGVGEKLDLIDGAFSWDAWPKPGQTRVASTEDLIYKHTLNGKKYMMGVSPYFYTKLPQWNKNWYCPSDSLWYDRWQQVLEIMPDFVEIITWNDYGESSYICDTVPAQVVEGADKYVSDYPHAAFRAVLPYLIAAYKAGSTQIDYLGEDTAIAWYRTTPAMAGEDGDTKCGQGGSESAAEGTKDVVSVMAITKGSTSVTVAIGGHEKVFRTKSQIPISYFEMPFDCNMTGLVTLEMNGKTTRGPWITNKCCDGQVNFNSVAIQV
ncbi:glycoside hydrolase [Podospora didyma]|uniref:Glycoside hydrolase n=1 Tax=Podospora didyma TaxID=330526 RepID=A0AAE0NIC2_9PEZI|nr:glycoside hydrolase [Podospora didyma]